MQIIDNIAVFGDHEKITIDQMKVIASDERCIQAALCADGHLGYSMPVGGVVAYKGCINVNGVGYDIGCGNKAVRLDCDADAVRSNIYRTMNEINKHISFGIGRKNDERVDHSLFDDDLWGHIGILRHLKPKAIDQLGTVGSGNHYVDLFIDDLDRVWCGVHFGSRGLGHSIATHFITKGGGVDGVHAKAVIFEEDSDLGEQYIQCMDLAGRYAYAGRDWVCSRVARILQANIVEEVHNHHNFAWRETHNGSEYWVVRKGSTPNNPGIQSFVGGSMGDYSYILEGIDGMENNTTLRSTVHGAGRVLGRMQAKGKSNRKTGAIIRPGLVSQKDMDDWIDRFDVELRGGGIDESPQCYRRIESVLDAHSKSVKIIHKLKPIGVCMADGRTHDPYKD